MVGVGIWHAVVDPVGSIFDAATGNYVGHNLDYTAEDAVLDAAADVLLPGSNLKSVGKLGADAAMAVGKGAAKGVEKAAAKKAEKEGYTAMSKTDEKPK